MKTYEYIPQSVSHPGIDLEEKLEELGMGPKEFAIRTGKPEKTVTAILKGSSSITPEMAVQFEKVLRIPAHYWVNRQRIYDEWVARARQKEAMKASEQWARRFPYADMAAKQWVPQATTIKEKTEALLSFFGIAHHKGWEDYFVKQQLKVAFRISLAHTKEPYAISAWLRQGELHAEKIPTKPYSESKFKEALAGLKSLMAAHPDDCFKRLQEMCLSAGVKVVYTPCLPKAPISGATRWIHDSPLIQLTGRSKRKDTFWFTFFHEVGHILLHGKKEIFLEEVEYAEKDTSKEKEADQFAIKWTLTEAEEAEICKPKRLSDQDIIEFARRFETNPAVIIGRLQHKERLPYTRGVKFTRMTGL